MKIKKIVCGLIDNNNYLLIKDKNCLIVDLSDFKAVDEYISSLNLNIIGILLTHTHWDHLLGVEQFVQKYKVPVYLSSNRPNYISDADFSYTLKKYGISTQFDTEKIELKYLSSGSHSVGEFNFDIISVPGHTSCSIIFYFLEEKVMFTGDFLFRETIGITNTQLSNKKDMKKSLKKIKDYPDDTVIYPGHGKSSNLKHEKLYNKFLF